MNNAVMVEKRKELGMSQAELAKKLKVSQKSVSKYERGERKPSYETLVSMSSLFGVSVDYLLNNDCKDIDSLSEPEKKLLHTFSELNEDNRDILIGKAKELLKDQRKEESSYRERGLNQLEEEYKKSRLDAAKKKERSASSTTEDGENRA